MIRALATGLAAAALALGGATAASASQSPTNIDGNDININVLNNLLACSDVLNGVNVLGLVDLSQLVGPDYLEVDCTALSNIYEDGKLVSVSAEASAEK